MEKVLITGAAGFIGSHLCDKFISSGFFVIGIDNLLTGNIDNISHLINKNNFEFIECDVTKGLVIDANVDYILHFACPASPVDYMNYPIETLKVDSLGTLNTLELAKEKGARYLFASTSEIYGDPLEHPQKEEYWGNVNSVGPRSVYDEAKRFSEALCMAYYRKYKMDIRIVRIFNTYGPRMRINDGRVVPNFIYQALTGHDLTVYGTGEQTRSFCYISDLLEGIYKVVLKKGIDGQIFNLGNPDEYKILDFAKIIIEKTKSKSGMIFKPGLKDDPKRRCPDITKAKKILNWEPYISLEIGLEKTIDYFKSLFKDDEILK